MRSENRGRGREGQPPVVLVKWYDTTRWLLERIDSFPKSQRFIFGQRLADHAIDVLELLVEASYTSDKLELLARANREIEVLRWLVRLAKDRKLFTQKQYLYSCTAFAETGRMVGGWLKHAAGNFISRIADEPVYRIWPEAVVHVGDCPIVPVAEYSLTPTMNGVSFSDSLAVNTIAQPFPKYWADVVGDFVEGAWTGPQGTVNMSDIMAVLQGFSSTPSAPPLTWCDLDGQSPNAIVNMTDVQQAVAGSKGEPYPFSDQELCLF